MISLEEVQVGDWLMWKSDRKDNAFPIQLTLNIIENEFIKWNNKFEFISLTPDILIKNDFLNLGSYYYYEDDNIDVVINFETKNIKVRNKKEKLVCGSMDLNSGDKLKTTLFVHKLQHMYKICNIKKEIKII